MYERYKIDIDKFNEEYQKGDLFALRYVYDNLIVKLNRYDNKHRIIGQLFNMLAIYNDCMYYWDNMPHLADYTNEHGGRELYDMYNKMFAIFFNHINIVCDEDNKKWVFKELN